MLFNYQWQGLQQQIQQLSFSLPLQEVNRKHHKKFVANSANQYVYIELYKAARKINPKDARVNIYRQGQDIEVQVTSRSPEQLEKWQRTIQRSSSASVPTILR
ncbi:hypothetical protein RS130_00970 [Paraglaciecola aquimarina]|uniref:Uncharacterized protein n=1 Tax=Paraglaciecola aquimarina TaxID=1235557 RepID=A0ABU3SRQ3_9ALTE|nr:hypothetical protein [Paraglaciecola aquimarina]MDU0352672.1 hypothetical protein [Paraglaciecola aquimarina]